MPTPFARSAPRVARVGDDELGDLGDHLGLVVGLVVATPPADDPLAVLVAEDLVHHHQQPPELALVDAHEDDAVVAKERPRQREARVDEIEPASVAAKSSS